MRPIDQTAAAGFSAAAKIYGGARPGYPPEALAWLREDVGLAPGTFVLDLGAGAGNFVPLLKETGATIMALDPVEAMREELARRHPDIHVLWGQAADIPLPNDCLDAVVCAQAFHWFATSEALAEIGRVLAPGGVLGLIWNGRDESVPWVAALSEIADAVEGDVPRYKSGAWRQVFPAEGFTALAERQARNRHVGSPEQVIVQRTLSSSFVAALAPDRRDAVEQQVRTLIDATPELAGQAEIAFPYETTMAAFRKTPG